MGQKLRRASSDAAAMLNGANKRVIFSRFTCDPYDCRCKTIEGDIMSKMALMNEAQKESYLQSRTPVRCPLVERKSHFYLHCPECAEIVASVYADNEHLKNYCDLHYISWHDDASWQGTYGVNINPRTAKVTIECCCGFKDIIDRYTIEKSIVE